LKWLGKTLPLLNPLTKEFMTAINQAVASSFSYQPPASAYQAKRILLKPNLGYPKPAPVTVSMSILQAVLQGLRLASPQAEILIVEGVCSPVSLMDIAAQLGVDQLLDNGMQLLDADELPIAEYPNISKQPVRYATMWAPTLLQEVDCRISLGTLKRTNLKGEILISASLKNLYGLFPRTKYKARSSNSRGQLHRPNVPAILQDVYFSIGHLFDGAVVDADKRLISSNWQPDRGQTIQSGQVFWGNSLLETDRLACLAVGEDIPSYIKNIQEN
jgi:Domain of unknown function (DUF362)